MDPNNKVPGHLRRYIVRQDYSQYTEGGSSGLAVCRAFRRTHA